MDEYDDAELAYTHKCHRCGHCYKPVGDESEDCPRCGYNGYDPIPNP